MAREFVGEGLFKVLEPHLVKGEKVSGNMESFVKKF